MSWLERKFLKLLGECKLHGFIHNFQIDAYDIRYNEIRTFYADFCFPELKLIIECDSEMYHSKDYQKRRDGTRQEILEQAGFTVVRFSSKQILKEREATKTALKKAVWEAAIRKALLPQ